MGLTIFPASAPELQLLLCIDNGASLEGHISHDACDTHLEQNSIKSCPEPDTPKRAIAREKRSATMDAYKPPRLKRCQSYPPTELPASPSMKDRSFRVPRSRFIPSDPPQQSLREYCKSRTFQGRQPSVLVRPNFGTGDAQASPPHERNDSDENPIDTIVRRVQEAGHYVKSLFRARVKALAASVKGGMRK